MPCPSRRIPNPRVRRSRSDVLYEDADLIVLVKRPAWSCIPAPAIGREPSSTRSSTIAATAFPASRRQAPGIVHRLDKDTSGVMVVAKNDAAHRHLSDQFADHGRSGPLERAYRAVVWGRPRQLKGKIDAPWGGPATGRNGPSNAKTATMHARRSHITRWSSAITRNRTALSRLHGRVPSGEPG
ncbi:hypothetical protein F2981_02775 [Sinorhizobium meliloti]|nr:hypothetical protein [Sinorhizobium meliloti]